MKSIPDTHDKSPGNQIHFMVMQFMEAVETAPNKNPLFAARLYFIFGSLMWNAYAVMDSSFPFVDDFEAQRVAVNPRYPPSSRFQVFQRLAQACFEGLRTYCLPGLGPLIIPEDTPNFVYVTSVFAPAVAAYLTSRNDDGYSTTRPFSFPNQDHYIVCGTDTIQDLNAYLPSPGTWAPLETHLPGGVVKRQSPLKPYFSEVRNWFSTAQMDEMYGVAADHYPDGTVFQEQVASLVTAMTNLTQRQKLIAEVWAGAEPLRATPPGKWMILLALLLAAKGYPLKESVSLIGGVGFSLFHAGVAAWGVKYRYMQARPIQVLREQYLNQSLWFPITNTTGNGGAWLPYQQPTLYTPPFPDFISGHSTFSMACATFLQTALGSDAIPITGCTIAPSYFRWFSSNFDKVLQPTLFSILAVPPKCCYVDTALTTVPVELDWTSWTQLAREAGASRIYGNIHWDNSNSGGLAVGQWVAIQILNHVGWDGLGLSF